jgi:NAD+ synthase
MIDKNLATKISNWLKDYLETSNLDCYVVGVSGGIDSATSSTLCAMTGKKTYVVNIPITSKEGHTALSHLQCDWLRDNYENVEKVYIDATEAYKSFEELFKDGPRYNLLSNANSKSRIRMMVLYYLATSHNGLVVGTGNKVEDFGVGFFTKYGDGGVDISPIADLLKSEVRSLAASLGIPEEILNAPPTDGLWEDSRTDEAQIGASYEELEWAMDHIESGRSPTVTTRQEEVLNIYDSFHNKNKHKMVGIPTYKVGGEK